MKEMRRNSDTNENSYKKSLNRIKRVAGWSTIRNLGELHILTKISYMMLVIVPILAGIWRIVTPVLNTYTLDSLYSPLLPMSFAAIFFASLSVLVAHLIYQIYAPIEIRQYNLDQFVRERIEDYARRQTPEALQEARSYLPLDAVDDIGEYPELDAQVRDILSRSYEKAEEDAKKTFSVKHDEKGTFIQLFIDLVGHRLEQIEYEQKVEMYEYLLGANDGILDTYNIKRPNTYNVQMAKTLIHALANNLSEERIGATGISKYAASIMERSAKAQYSQLSVANFAWAFAAFILYALAIYLILLIIYKQSYSVMQAAGMKAAWNVLWW